MPKIVELQLPEVEHLGEEAAAIALKMKAPASKFKNDGLWVELTEQNMHYLRVAMLASCGDKDGRKHRHHGNSKNCRRITKRKQDGYLASRDENGKRKHRFFADDSSCLQIQEKILKWQAGQDTDHEDAATDTNENNEQPSPSDNGEEEEEGAMTDGAQEENNEKPDSESNAQ